MKDILCEIPITTKNKKSRKFENRFIIEKLYFEGEEKKVIQILDLTFLMKIKKILKKLIKRLKV